MRQAGRYQPEYREIRKKYTLLDICHNPEVCAQVTHLPVEQLGVDAAILFSDITLPFEAMNIAFDIVENKGPVIFEPIATPEDVSRLLSFDASASLAYVGESIKLICDRIDVPLIGFVGAPFTLASYLIEGGPSKNFSKSKGFMYNHSDAWHQMMNILALNMSAYLRYQVESGCSAVQIFDSWVGNLGREDYLEYVYPHMVTLFSAIADLKVPKIHFGVVTGHILDLMRDCGADVVGLDWRVQVDQSAKMLGPDTAVQGNLEPSAILAPWNVLKSKLDYLLERAPEKGFIFNLGHGIMPQTDGEVLRRITDYVHSYGRN